MYNAYIFNFTIGMCVKMRVIYTTKKYPVPFFQKLSFNTRPNMIIWLIGMMGQESDFLEL